MAAPSRLPRTRQGAATRALAASSVASVASGYERGWAGLSSVHESPKVIRASESGVSRLARTIQPGGDL
jgi:hypothetical protein